MWDPEIDAVGPTRMVWLVAEANGATRLTVELYEVEGRKPHLRRLRGRVAMFVPGLKTLLETGRPLVAAS